MGYELKPSDVYDLARVLDADVHEKGGELFFTDCPYCRGGESRDKNTFSVNLTSGAFKCFRSGCGKAGHFVELARDFHYQLDFDNTTRPKVYRELPQRPIPVREGAVTYLQFRGIGRAIVERYRITTRRDRPDILVFPFYDEHNVLAYVKYRNTRFNGKGNKEWCEKDAKPVLFGMAQCEDFARLVITEGQIDSLTLAECGVPNAVSVPNGCNGFTFLENVWDWIVQFKEIVVFGDCEHGKITLLDTLQRRLPNVVKAVRMEDYLGEKDANDIFRKYGKQAVLTAVENAEVPPVSNVKRLSDVESVDIYSLPRIFSGIPELDRIIGGFYFGQIILLTGRRGEGKSTFMGQLMAEALDQGYSALAYSGELPDYHFRRWIDLQLAGPNHIVESRNMFDEPVYSLAPGVSERIGLWYQDRAYLYDNNAVDGEELESLTETIEHTIRRYGVKFICIDNLMTAMDVEVKEDLYRAQSAFVKKLKQIAVRHDVVILLVAHPKKTREQLENDDVSGSSDITNRADVVLTYSSNADKHEDNPEDCDSKLSVLKNRLTGRITRKGQEVELYFSRKSKRITSKKGFENGVKEYGWLKEKTAPGSRDDFEEIL